MKTFAYVGCRTTRERNARGKGIGIYAVDPDTTAWTLLGIHPTLDNPSFLALDDAQAVLYAIHGDGSQASAYRIDAETGRLTDLGAVSCDGRNPVHLALSADGAWLAIANYATGAVTRLPIGPGGALGRAAPLVALPGEPGPHPKEQGSSHPHQIARYTTQSSDTDWHIVPDKGLDTVFAVRWHDGREPEVVAHRWQPGSGPRHAAFHPVLPLIYVANELDSTMTTWAFDAQTGRMTPLDTIPLLPASFDGESSAAGIVIAPDGGSVYVSNRGHDSVAAIALDPFNGMPTLCVWVPTQGYFPRFLCLGPDGRRLYVANERSDTIVEFACAVNGRGLEATGQVIETGSPVCAVFKTR
ncbi:lactonase family protein [Burkholderia gladioli]|uniref:lactonase family protein n=1 Tax=Burkholderia gladioli TaxID=28095 RepID=UPI00164007E6|nr:lactonase family protein [Burkholderia gladioli]